MTSDEIVANPEGNNSEEDHPITADNSVYNSYVADIDSVFLPFTEYSSSNGIAEEAQTRMEFISSSSVQVLT